MSATEGFLTLKDWSASNTVLETYALSFSEWALWRKVRIDSLTESPVVLSLVEDGSNLEFPPLNLEGAELTQDTAGELPWPLEDVPSTEFKRLILLKLKDGKHILLVEPH